MTAMRAAEIAGTVTVAYVTTIATALEADASWLVATLAPIGVAALTGYFSARLTTESRLSKVEASVMSEIAGVKTLLEAQGNEFRRYYRLKGPDEV